jgi:TusA-related sulfurtransferase
MTESTSNQMFPSSASELTGDRGNNLGETFLKALKGQDFTGLEALFSTQTNFRALVPSGEHLGKTAVEAVGWLRRWFGKYDQVQILQSNAGDVFERLYLCYRLRLHEPTGEWRVIEQQAYCEVQDGKIAAMWLICTGFFADRSRDEELSNAAVLQGSRLRAEAFYDAGSLGCAEGPMDEIAGLMQKLDPGQCLEIRATDPSVAGDLPAFCRLSGPR